MRNLLFTVSLLLFTASFAQSVEVRTGVATTPTFGVAYVTHPSWGEAQFGVSYVPNTALVHGSFTAHASASAISNLTFDGSLAARFDGLMQGSFGVRGTIGPIAARFVIHGFNANPDAFWHTPSRALPRPDGTGFSAALSATYRNGNLVYTLQPTYTLTSTGQYVNIVSEVRWIRAIERHEMRFTGALWSGADWSELEGSVQATIVLNRGRKPAWEFGTTLTVNEHGVTPGVQFVVTEQFAGGNSVSIAGAVTPRSVQHPLVKLETRAQLPSGATQWHLAAVVSYDGAAIHGAGEIRLRVPLTATP